jgi:hypothetical protein
MSAKEYNVWAAEYHIEPFGQDREDIRSGMIVQSIRAQNSKEGVILKDCIVDFEPPKKTEWEQWQGDLKARTIAMGGKVK